jgi:hypothetical protein
MTTSRSPLRVLKAQADKIAAALKAAERGENIDGQFHFPEKIEAARAKENVTFGVVMDDKVLKIDVPWNLIRETGEVALAEFILNKMRGDRETAH